MISSLTGILAERSGSVVTLDVNGVGYEVQCTRGCLEGLSEGSPARVVVFTDVKEDSIRLYGFADQLEKQVFLLLVRVKGVGARSASDIVSKIDKRDLLRMIAAGDSQGLQAARGIGKKTAERIILELKDKVAEYALEAQTADFAGGRRHGGPVDEALEALQALGFSRRDAEKLVQQACTAAGGTALETAALVKEALKQV